MNGYFQLITMPTSTGIKVFPPTDSGEALQYEDVKEYLEDKSVSYRPAVLKEAVTDATGELVVLNDNSAFPERESYRLTISRDRMEASAFFYAPSEGAENMSPKEFLEDLAYRNIVYGIDTEAVSKYFQQRDYCKEIVIARGTKTREGANAKIDYQFKADLHAKPAMREDGSVDYFNLNIINHVKKGDELAILTPEDPGDPGQNIYGEILNPRPVKTKKLVAGKHT